jgi:hypothetical protein
MSATLPREGMETYQSPPTVPRPSDRPPRESRFAFWPAAAEAKLEGKVFGIVWCLCRAGFEDRSRCCHGLPNGEAWLDTTFPRDGTVASMLVYNTKNAKVKLAKAIVSV